MSNVFKNRNFVLVFLGALVSETGALLYSFAVSFYILEVSGNNAFLQGLYLAVCGAVTLLLTPVGGVLGDRFHKAHIMYICDFLKGGAIVSATVLMLLFRAPAAQLVILFAAGVIGSAIAGIFSPAASALLPHILEEGQLQQANSYFSIKSSLQSIVGVVLAGVLYASLPVYTLFFIVGACYIASGVSEMFIRYMHQKRAEKLTLKTAFSDMKEGVSYMKTQKALMILMIAILFVNFFMAPVYGNFLPYFVKTDIAGAPDYLFDRLLTPELWASVFQVLIGVSSLIGAAILSAQKPKDKCGKDVTLGLLVMAVLMIVMTLSYWLLVARGVSLNAYLAILCVNCLFLGFILARINIPINTTIMRVVEKDKLSKVNSLISIASQGLTPIASVFAGAILQGFGSTVLMVFCTGGFVATSLILLFNKRVKEI